MIYGKNIQVDCAYCENGTFSENTDEFICKKFGNTERRFQCRSFKYDPLMRQPEIPEIKEIKTDDFDII